MSGLFRVNVSMGFLQICGTASHTHEAVANWADFLTVDLRHDLFG